MEIEKSVILYDRHPRRYRAIKPSTYSPLLVDGISMALVLDHRSTVGSQAGDLSRFHVFSEYSEKFAEDSSRFQAFSDF